MKVVFAAGGTGGHVIPALTLAQELKRQAPQVDITFVGTPNGMETHMVPGAGFKLVTLDISGVKGKGIFRKLLSLVKLPWAFWKAYRLVQKIKPDAVFGIGGYASGPILYIAASRKRYTGILEPNAIPGFANRVLGRRVRVVYAAFPEALALFPKGSNVKVVGNVLRPEFSLIPPPDFSNTSTTVLKILIFGGSQGASKINHAVIEMLPGLTKWKKKLEFIHQTGKRDRKSVEDAYRQQGFTARVAEFIDDMPEAYANSHLVIARSGSSVLEIAACGRPAILIPYPFAADNHQLANAKAMQRCGGAVLLLDSDLNGQTLLKELTELLNHPKKLEEMKLGALTRREVGATAAIVKDILSRQKL